MVSPVMDGEVADACAFAGSDVCFAWPFFGVWLPVNVCEYEPVIRELQ